MALSEQEGINLLTTVFEARGYKIERDITLDGFGVRCSLDGYDKSKQVGFEYITAEAGDDFEYTRELVEQLERLMIERKLFVFLVDEVRDLNPDELRAAANAFIDQIQEGSP